MDAAVSGAATGIGKAIATRFAQEGAAVVIDYVGSPDAANEALSALRPAWQRKPQPHCADNIQAFRLSPPMLHRWVPSLQPKKRRS